MKWMLLSLATITRTPTWAAIIRCLSKIKTHLAQRQFLYVQCFLWPRNSEIQPWLRQRAHFGTRFEPLLLNALPLSDNNKDFRDLRDFLPDNTVAASTGDVSFVSLLEDILLCVSRLSQINPFNTVEMLHVTVANCCGKKLTSYWAEKPTLVKCYIWVPFVSKHQFVVSLRILHSMSDTLRAHDQCERILFFFVVVSWLVMLVETFRPCLLSFSPYWLNSKRMFSRNLLMTFHSTIICLRGMVAIKE